MVKRNDCLDAVVGELERFGIRSEVQDRSKHMEVLWRGPKGEHRSYFIPNTPSDHKAWLNCRGDVRRQLRLDGVELPKPNVLTLQHALSAPKPVEPQADRLSRLEEDRDVLLDWLVDGRAELAEALSAVATMKAQLANVRVTVSFDNNSAQPFAPVVEEAPKKKMGRRPREGISQADQVLNAFAAPGQWTAVHKLCEITGFDGPTLGRLLWGLKNAEKVENGQRGWWRKKPQELQVVSG